MITEIWDLATRKFFDTSKRQYDKGFEKYKKVLVSFNGRNPFTDAREEVVDLHQYITQAEVEFETIARLLYVYGVTEGFWNTLPKNVQERVLMVVGNENINDLCKREGVNFYGTNKRQRSEDI